MEREGKKKREGVWGESCPLKFHMLKALGPPSVAMSGNKVFKVVIRLICSYQGGL